MLGNMSEPMFTNNPVNRTNDTLEPSGNSTYESYDNLELVRFVYLVLSGAFSVLIVLGNGMVIVVTCARKRLRAQISPNWFVLSLATSDFLVGFVYFTNAIVCRYSIMLEFCNDPQYYYAQNFLMSIFYTASVVNLCLLTLDIYLGVVHPFRYQSFKKTSTVCCFLALAWVLAVAQNIPLVVYTMSEKHPEAARIADVVIQIGFMTGLPGLFMFYAYMIILRVATKHHKDIDNIRRDITANEPLNQTEKPQRRGRSGTVKAVGVVVAIFLFSNAFYQYYVLCDVWPETIQMPYLLRVVTLLLRYFYSSPNFFVYAFFRKDFRREMKALLWCCKRKERKPATDTYSLK